MSTIAPQRPTRPQREQLLPVGPDTWRLVDRSGRVLGNIVERATELGTRYLARRYHVPTQSHLELGAFWCIDDARDALRWM